MVVLSVKESAGLGTVNSMVESGSCVIPDEFSDDCDYQTD